MSDTKYTVFEDDRASRDDRLYDAGTMLERIAAYFREDGYDDAEWSDRCDEAWERTEEDAA